MEKATFAGGCFWCTEAIFKRLKGVSSVLPGYSGGDIENPTYEQVCSGQPDMLRPSRLSLTPKSFYLKSFLKYFFIHMIQQHQISREMILVRNIDQQFFIKKRIKKILPRILLKI